MKAEEALALSKAYTKKTLEGSGAQKGEKGDPGKDGKSAYQIWLDEGNTGDEADFLESLKGEKGDTGAKGDKGDKGDAGAAGPTGAKGVDGKDGKTAYEYAKDGGYTGTESEFSAKMAADAVSVSYDESTKTLNICSVSGGDS